MAVGQVDIVDDRCVDCGRCAIACSKSSINLGDDLQTAIEILNSGVKTVAVLSPEYPATFYPMTANDLALLVEQAGFCGLEDTALGEEIVAKQYLRYFSVERDHPVIRSTCPAITAWIEKYHPDLKDYLAPIATPMIVQGRLIKNFYGDDTAIIYATPCVAAKAEAKVRQPGIINAVLTFKEFKQLLKTVGSKAKGIVVGDKNRPELKRRYSVPGGFPRPTIARYNMLDTALMVVKDTDKLDELADTIRRGETKAKYIDLLFCNGCIDGPGIDSNDTIQKRKQIVEASSSERLMAASEQITFDQMEPLLPSVEAHRCFIDRHVNLPLPSAEVIEDILMEGEKLSLEDELNCGACGYKTCRELAIAIYQGVADWNMCFPFERVKYRRLIEELKETAVTDGLTGLANHKSFKEHLAIEFNRAQRYGSKLSLMMIDVDTFKQVNDTYGHVTGDAVLKAVAGYIKGNIRQPDIAARYGGDEFALILPETDLEKAYKVGEKLRKKVQASPIILNPDIVIYTTLSIGVGSYESLMTDPVLLIEKADEALYRAKQAGRNKTMTSDNVTVD
ncbi:MAG: diguanylate cyclase [Rubrobacteridae bacterium]|nr:diguanylate cyclase [Rubrobacteridae bacterium]